MELSSVGRTASFDAYTQRQNIPARAESSQNGIQPDLNFSLGDTPPVQEAEKTGEAGRNGSCQTCANRKYQDGSDDPGVSYKTPTKIDAGSAASAVRAHEMEHVTREQFKAFQEGRKVVSQTVTMHSGICPECGKVYISGGTTRTVTKGQEAQLFQAGSLEQPESGRNLSVAV